MQPNNSSMLADFGGSKQMIRRRGNVLISPQDLQARQGTLEQDTERRLQKAKALLKSWHFDGAEALPFSAKCEATHYKKVRP
jgi:hypothetical protein